MGAADSKTRAHLLDVTAEIMIEDGYAAATSRRVAARAGVKPALVHYYFRTMDDLFIALLRRGAQATLRRYDQALAADQPLRALWELSNDPRDAALTMEFIALANHRKAIRAEIATYAERFREKQIATLARALRESTDGARAGAGAGVDGVTPAALIFIMTAVSRIMVLERALGIGTGHQETLALVQRFLDHVEPPAAS
ncbi:MAG: TetR/AcrR family transcriptional regulator [Frankia sp.]|nr:TetR/AcrR family transcriptional regulator [Frankia sp.]